MANQWVRLWIDLPNDPKFRTISRISGEAISTVIAVYIHMLCCAANATERGRTQGWCDEDIATALDIQIEKVALICEVMQGRLLDGDYLTGWKKRQPIKEDGAAERGKAWREAKKQEKKSGEEKEKNGEQTQPNATERKRSLDKIREDIYIVSGKPDVESILNYLNDKAGKKFRPCEANIKLVAGRLKEGATVEDCKAVIDLKVKEWLQDEKMSEFLRPKTLFNPTNFSQYLGGIGELILEKDWI